MRIFLPLGFLLLIFKANSQGAYNDNGFISQTAIILNASQNVFSKNKVKEIFFSSPPDSIKSTQTEIPPDSIFWGLDQKGCLAYRKKGTYTFIGPYDSVIKWNNYWSGYDTTNFNQTKKGFFTFLDSFVFDSGAYNKKGQLISMKWKQVFANGENQQTINFFDKNGLLEKQFTHNSPSKEIFQARYIYDEKKRLKEIVYSYGYCNDCYYNKTNETHKSVNFEITHKKEIQYRPDNQISTIKKSTLNYDPKKFSEKEVEIYEYKNGLLDKIITKDPKTNKVTYIQIVGYVFYSN